MGWWFGTKLWKRVFLGLILGVAFGLFISQSMDAAAAEKLLTDLKIVGDIFIASIRLVIIPLIFLTLVAGVLALGDPARLGTIGLKTIALYLATTFFANIIGLIMGSVFRPGAGVDLGAAAPKTVSTESAGLLDRLAAMAMKNPFEKFLAFEPMTLALTAILIVAAIVAAMRSVGAGEKRSLSGILFVALFALGVAASSGDILVVIFFSLVLGVAFLFMGAAGAPAARFFAYASDKVLVVTQWIMELAPFGVFALIAWVAGTRGLETFTAVFMLAIAVYLGCFLHMGIVYGGIIKFGLKLPFINFFRGILDAMMVAYSTSSSSATLPVTIASVRKNLGVSKSVAGSVLPLGATINMDGTGLYQGVAAVFIANALGLPLDFGQQLMIVLTAALASIGTAAVPGVGIVMLVIVLKQVGLPEAGIGLILAVDRPLDMCRTVLNVTGDATVATVVASSEGLVHEGERHHPAA